LRELSRRALLRTYEERGSLSKLGQLYWRTLRTERDKAISGRRGGGAQGPNAPVQHSPRRTPLSLEVAIVAERKKTGYGPDRIARLLQARGQTDASS